MMRTPTLAVLALLGLVACDVDSDGDGVAAQFDCDDTNPDINEDAEEICDGLDNNCDGRIDNQTTDAPTFYADFDRDGYGDPEATTSDCRFDPETGGPDPDFEPFGYVRDNTDCDDALKTVNPEAEERCDGIDNNCDGDVDGDDAIDKLTWYADSDDDGFGDAESTTEACDQPTGHVDNDLDCDDTTDASNPSADEICDGSDNDCDGDVDEDDAIDASAWYLDMDEDGFGDPDTSVFACAAPEGYLADNTDCNDEAAEANPDGTEVCDGLDNDCDSTTSEAGTVSLNGSTESWDSIQSAINGASDGDTVYVCEGTWNEWISINVGLTLVGGGGSEAVILDGMSEDNGSVITVLTPSAVTIEGFTVQNGYNPGEESAGGISAGYTTGDLTLRDVVVDGNEGFTGGLIGPLEGTTIIEDSRFTNNMGYYGGGLVMNSGSLTDVRILDNEAYVGGGAFFLEGDITLENTRIISNYAEAAGGGIVVVSGATVDGGEVLNNLSDDEAGGVFLDGEISNMDIRGNRATDYGGGVYMSAESDVDALIDSCTIDGNKAPYGAGIAGDSHDFTVQNSDIINNEASATGGGIWNDGGLITIETCAIEGNTATAGGGMHQVSGTATVTTSDWGTAADANDNDPDDIYTDASETAWTTFGTGESFICSTDGDCT